MAIRRPLFIDTTSGLVSQMGSADEIDGANVTGVPLFVQDSAPSYAAGPYIWFDTSLAFTMWVEDGAP